MNTKRAWALWAMAAATVLALTACASKDETALKKIYAEHYQQDDAEIKAYKRAVRGKTAEQLAIKERQVEAAKFGGKKRVVIDDYMTWENVSAQGSQLVFDYALTGKWQKLTIKSQEQQIFVMQKDLIYRNCALKTRAVAYGKGLQEVHRYFDQYPSRPSFHLTVNESVCRRNGFFKNLVL